MEALSGISDNREKEFTASGHELPPRLIDLGMELIDPEKMAEYREWMKQQGKEELFYKMVENLRFVDTDETMRAIRELADKVNEYLGEDEYYLLIDIVGKSGGYIWELAKPYLKKPAQVIEILKGKSYPERDKSIGKFIYLNDAAYSGHQDGGNVYKFCKKFGVEENKIAIAHLAMTNFAANFLRNDRGLGALFYIFNFPTMDEIFTQEEQEQMHRIFSWDGTYRQAVLSFFRHRVPDNFFGGFQSRMGQMYDKRKVDPRDMKGQRLYLINTKQFNGGYKKDYEDD